MIAPKASPHIGDRQKSPRGEPGEHIRDAPARRLASSDHGREARYDNPGKLRGGVMSEELGDAMRDDVSAARDPRHVFLNSREVMRRYGWGKTKGYQNLKDRALIPPPVMTHPDRWRLDQLLAWEERRMAMAEAALMALVEPDRQAEGLADLLPPAKRARRRSA
jgi:hypothetical protein